MGLLVIPSIDIQYGKTVRVVQGVPEVDCKEFGHDPVELAMIWRTENARMIHVVDFDAAFSHDYRNLPLLESICTNIIIPIEYSGGIRSLEDAKNVFNTGVTRLALATLPLSDKKEFAKILEKFGPSRIVICIDVIDDEVVIRGRKEKSGLTPVQHALNMAEMGVQRFVVTDVSRNGMMSGPNIALSRSVAEATGKRVTLSGGISSKDDLIKVQENMDSGIDSVIVGRALYENRFPCQKIWRMVEADLVS